MSTPLHFPIAVRLQVRFNETDLQGHVNFAWYLNYFDVALTNYLKAIGFSYQQMVAGGLDLLYVDAHAAYHSPAYFDETLLAQCRVDRIGNTSVRFEFQVTAESDQRLVATGEITTVMAESEHRRKVRVPDQFREAVQRLQVETIA